jgi:hypothetical protein
MKKFTITKMLLAAWFVGACGLLAAAMWVNLTA